ncbi:MAG: NADH dehydrogenase subunit, partial [Methanoregulaceae archaeon]|nr:NADH dehydrogenase subunit [Methanoregulaceae archaeon]
TDKVERVDIRTPTMANWTSVAMCLAGQNIADIPVIVAAVDPCLSCTSRITVARDNGKRTGEVTLDELRRRFISRHRGPEGP